MVSLATKDKLDGHLVAWYVGSPMQGDRCLVCAKGYRRGARCLVERVLPGVNVRPHTCHRKPCWATHQKRTTQEAKRQEKAIALAEEVF